LTVALQYIKHIIAIYPDCNDFSSVTSVALFANCGVSHYFV